MNNEMILVNKEALREVLLALKTGKPTNQVGKAYDTLTQNYYVAISEAAANMKSPD